MNNLLPLGGGAFRTRWTATLCSSRTIMTLTWHGKFRGPDFAPVTFELSMVTSDRLQDSKGRRIPTVLAKPMSEREQSAAEANHRGDEDGLLVALLDHPGASYTGIADALRWMMFTSITLPLNPTRSVAGESR